MIEPTFNPNILLNVIEDWFPSVSALHLAGYGVLYVTAVRPFTFMRKYTDRRLHKVAYFLLLWAAAIEFLAPSERPHAAEAAAPTVASEMLDEPRGEHLRLVDRRHEAGPAPMLRSFVAVRPAESGSDVRYARPDELLKIVVDAMRTVVDIDPRRSSRELLLHTMRDVDGSNELFA